jgi:adenylosuccinate synthase
MVVSELDRKREVDLIRTIASTGQGVGYATARKILFRGCNDAEDPVQLANDIPELRPFIRSVHEELESAYREGARILLEGTQGTGLSIHHGAYPYVTSRDTTVAGCLSEAGISPTRVRHVLMVNRTYPIRVQDPPEDGTTSGPMSQPLTWEEISKRSSIDIDELYRCERTSTTGRQRRVAEFDWSLLKRAASLNAPTDIALTFVDYLSVSNRAARRFEQLTRETINFIQDVEAVAGARVSLISTRFHSRSIIDRRTW